MMIEMLVLLLISCASAILPPEAKFDEVDGDVQIAYIDYFSRYSFARSYNLLPFLKAMKNITHQPTSIKVGYVICSIPFESPVTTILEILEKYPKIVAVIGIRLGDDAGNLVPLAAALQLPVFTFANGMTIDTLLRIQHENYVTPITSQNILQVSRAIPDIINHLGIDILGVLHSPSNYTELAEFLGSLGITANKVDIEFGSVFDKTQTEMLSHTALAELKNNTYLNKQGDINRLKTVIALMEHGSFKAFLKLLEEESASNLLILTDSSGCTFDYGRSDQSNALKARNVSVLYLCQTYYRQQELIDFMKTYDYTESDILTNWYSERKTLKCPSNVNCPSFSEFILNNGTYYSRYNHRIYYTTLKLLKALENTTQDDIKGLSERTYETLIRPSAIGKTILNNFKKNNIDLPPNTTFMRFDENGKFESDYEVVFASGKTLMSIYWVDGRDEVFAKDASQLKHVIISDKGMRIRCSVECIPGMSKDPDPRFQNCWECSRCSGNTISTFGNTTKCTHCNSNNHYPFWSNENHTNCDRPPNTLSMDKTSGKLICGIVAVNILVLFITVKLYCVYWNNRVIISSSRYLSSITFLGLLSGHVTSIILAIFPDSNTCIVIQVSSYFFMALTTAPLTVKTFRIWLVFKYTIKLGQRIKKYISDTSSLAQTLGLIIPQMTILLLSLYLSPEQYRFIVKYEEESLVPTIKVTQYCGPSSLHLVYASIGFTAIQLIISTGFGWQCRKVPDNFKESIQIFLTYLICFLLVGCYVPAMVILPGYTQIISLAIVLTVIALTINVVLFVPKLYCVMFMSPLEQRQRFRAIKSGTFTNSVIEKNTVAVDQNSIRVSK